MKPNKTIVGIILTLVVLMILTAGSIVVLAQMLNSPEEVTATTGEEKGLYMIGAGIAAGLALLSAGYSLGMTCVAAISAITEKPELFGMTFAYVVFVEAIGIYGLVIAFMVIGKL